MLFATCCNSTIIIIANITHIRTLGLSNPYNVDTLIIDQDFQVYNKEMHRKYVFLLGLYAMFHWHIILLLLGTSKKREQRPSLGRWWRILLACVCVTSVPVEIPTEAWHKF